MKRPPISSLGDWLRRCRLPAASWLRDALFPSPLPDRDHWLHHLAQRCERTSLKPRSLPRWTPYRHAWRWDPAQTDDDPIDMRWVRQGKLVLAGSVLLGALSWKMADMTAGVPQVMVGGETAKTIASADFRSVHRREQMRQVRPDNYDLTRFPVSDATEKHWRNLLWTTAVVQPTESFVRDAVDQLLGMMAQPGLSGAQVRTVDMATKVGTQLYLTNPTFYASFGARFVAAIAQSTDPQWVAVSLSNLARAGAAPQDLQTLMTRVKTRFPNWSTNVYLQTTVRDVAERLAPTPLPPLGDLLNWEIAPKQLHLYVICQGDRDVLCRSILKDRDGQFVRHQDGKLWSVPLLLRSIHNLAWNFSRGQTPQGIYRIEGQVPQPDDDFFRAYGQFALVNLFVPFEAGAKAFAPGKSGSFTGSVDDYTHLLPPSWRGVWAMQQTYWAGKTGRGLFRVHGTGDAPDFFSSKGKDPDSYNWNPTIGCLSALELYNEKGQLLEADMPKILQALEAVAGPDFTGYMVVVDVSGKVGEPITLAQLDQAIGKTMPARSSHSGGNDTGSAVKRSATPKSSKLPNSTPEPEAKTAKPLKSTKANEAHSMAQIGTQAGAVSQPPVAIAPLATGTQSLKMADIKSTIAMALALSPPAKPPTPLPEKSLEQSAGKSVGKSSGKFQVSSTNPLESALPGN